MAIVEWSDSFKIGEDEIDKEHWGLFALIHDLGEKFEQGAAEASINLTIEALVAYVDIHYDHEERLMQDSGYPAFEDHKRAHEALTRRVAGLQEDWQRAPETIDLEALMDFLSNWLSEHILNVDMKFAAYYKQQ